MALWVTPSLGNAFGSGSGTTDLDGITDLLETQLNSIISSCEGEGEGCSNAIFQCLEEQGEPAPDEVCDALNNVVTCVDNKSTCDSTQSEIFTQVKSLISATGIDTSACTGPSAGAASTTFYSIFAAAIPIALCLYL